MASARIDFDPPAARRAMLREGLSMAALGLMLPLGLRSTQRRTPRCPEERTLVFVHGLAANRSSFLPLQTYLRVLGHRRQLAVTYRSRGSIEALALGLRRQIDACVRGGRIDLVAHSMGGLVARFYLQQLGGARRVDRLITLATPHRGSHAANFIPASLVRQLLPGSSFLRHLNALPPPAGVEVTSVVAGRDLLVQPVESSHCPFGEVREFPQLGHVELLFRPEVFTEVGRLLVPGAGPTRRVNQLTAPGWGGA